MAIVVGFAPYLFWASNNCRMGRYRYGYRRHVWQNGRLFGSTLIGVGSQTWVCSLRLMLFNHVVVAYRSVPLPRVSLGAIHIEALMGFIL
jgi:hypothetical protein